MVLDSHEFASPPGTEIEELLNEAMIIAGLFYVPPEDVERMSEINERLGELGL